MSAHNFWHNFTHGFMHGMFGNSPFFGCWGGFTPIWGNPFIYGGGFGSYFNPFCGNSSIFMTPNIMTGGFYTLMPDVQPPGINNLDLNINALFPTDNVWDNLNKQINMQQNMFDTFAKKTDNNDTFPDSTPSPNTSLVNKTTNKTKTTTQTSPGKYDDLISKYSKINNIDENLVRAVIQQESGFNPNAKSSAGAIGLMQLMPGTAKELGVTDPYDPEQNIKGGTKYLKQMLDKFNGNTELALAAYNAGPHNAALKKGKIPQNGQTPKYVSKVMDYYEQYKTIA